MKAGIISLYGNINYGNKLQCRAVAELLKQRGIDPLVLQPRSDPAFISYCWYIAKKVERQIKLDKIDKERSKQIAKYTEEIPVRLLLSKSAKKRCSDELDYLIIGSDQIWHPKAVRIKDERFGSFYNDTSRIICISPSFGISDLYEDCLGYYRKNLNRLKYISVREEAGAELVLKLTGKVVPVLADPTIGLSRSFWESELSNEKCPDHKYILKYYLGKGESELNIKLRQYSEEMQYEIIDLMDKGSEYYYCSSVSDFLGLIANADLVITDSFHASIFSIIFKIPLVIMPRIGGSDMSSRLVTLANTYELNDLIMSDESDVDFYRLPNANYLKAQNIMELERLKLNEYLDNALMNK